MLLESYNENIYLKNLEILLEGLDKVDVFIDWIQEEKKYDEIDLLIDIYDSIFFNKTSTDSIEYNTSRINRPHYVRELKNHTKANSYWHIILRLKSEDIVSLDKIYNSRLSKLLKLYINTFSKVNNFMISFNSKQLMKFKEIIKEVKRDINKFLESSFNKAELDKKEKLSDEKLQNLPFGSFFHMTDIHNLKDILDKGMFSHNLARDFGLLKVDNSNQMINDKRDRVEKSLGGNIHDFVPLYINPRNSMLEFIIKNDKLNDLIFLRVTPHIILEDNVFFSDGNAASKTTKFYSETNDLDMLDWDVINDKWNSSSTNEIKKKEMSEVLVKHEISLQYINEIIFNNNNNLDYLMKLFPNHLGITLTFDEEIFKTDN